jgi:EmrB/QacA subfamily drug resistance transporter
MDHGEAAQAVNPTRTGAWVLVATILVSGMAFIDTSALNVALPAIQADLRASGPELLWIVNGYLLMLAALILTGGSLGDRLGRKRVFMGGVVFFLAGSLACGLAPSAGWLIAARIVQGVGGAVMIPGSLAIITAFFPAGQRGSAIGTWSSATTMVTIAGPLLGGLLADAGWWRGVFLINLPLGGFALWVLARHVPESRAAGQADRLDIPGALLVALGLSGLTFGFISAPERGFNNPLVVTSLGLGAVALAGFVVVEARSRQPMLPLALFRSPTFTGANLLTLFLYGALSVGLFFLSLTLVQVQGYRQAQAGLALLPFTVLLTLLSRWAGGLVDRLGACLPLIVGPALAGLGFALLAIPDLGAGPEAYWRSYFPGIATFGLGMAVTVAPLTATVMNSADSSLPGAASGVNNAIARTAGVLAIAIVGSIALFGFSASLDARAQALPLSQSARQDVQAEAAKLGLAAVPSSVPADQAGDVRQAIDLAFLDAFRLVMIICAALAWLSAGMAAWLIAGPGSTQAQIQSRGQAGQGIR